jgi:GT2 family glycosyltransferase
MSDDVVVHGVMVTFRRPADLGRSLAALSEQDHRLASLVVVDNAPDPAVEAVVAACVAAPRVDYVAAPDNLGPAGGIARGMDHVLGHAADADWVCVLDDDDPLPDTAIVADHARDAAAASATTAGVGAGGARFDWSKGRLVPVEPPAGSWGTVDYLKSNWAPLYRVAALRAVGTFDPRLFFGFDDLEFGLRLRAANWELRVDPHGRRVRDPSAGPSRRIGPVDWRRYYSLRNLVWLLRTHDRSGVAARVALTVGVAKPLANLPFAPRPGLQHLKLGVRASLDGWRGTLGRTITPDAARRQGAK